MKAGQCAESPTALMVLLCLLAMVVPAAKAQVQRDDFDVSDGKIERSTDGHLMVLTKEMRATLKFLTPQSVNLKFTYLGPTSDVSRLGNGEVRSQFGIKLRAQDTCNVVYVMWHFAPDQKIAVSVKRNPGKRTHEECLDNGYINGLKPLVLALPKNIRPSDQSHSFTASMNGSDLTVTADGIVVWKGDLGRVALEFNGPVGLRSDNADLVFEFWASR